MSVIDLIPQIKDEIVMLQDVLDFEMQSVVTRILNRVVVIEFHIAVDDVNPMCMLNINFYIGERELKVECVARNGSELLRSHDKREIRCVADKKDVMKNLKHAFARHFIIGKKIADASGSNVW